MIAALPAVPKPLDPSDRRRSDRQVLVCRAWIISPTAKSDDEWVEVGSANLSKHGIGFCHTQPLAVNTFHELKLTLGRRTILTEVRILSSTERPAQARVPGNAPEAPEAPDAPAVNPPAIDLPAVNTPVADASRRFCVGAEFC